MAAATKVPPAWALGLPIEVDPSYGCWLWKGQQHHSGYGLMGREMAHRAVYSINFGYIPTKARLDHMCRRRLCVRPSHMDLVSNRENVKRIFARYRRTLERCAGDHRLDEFGLDTPEGGVVCRVCNETDS